jgi:crossover junction endodeoxyribonuclease RuvC
VVVEEIFVSRNVRSALKLGHARGTALLAGVVHDLPVFEYTALQVKNAVVGYGRADKAQVQSMVKALLGLPEIAQEDASDALAAAICHAHSSGMNNRLENALGRKGR